jgi:hypothetical protein
MKPLTSILTAKHLSVVFFIAVLVAGRPEATRTETRTAPQGTKRILPNPHKNDADPVEVFIWANDLQSTCDDDTVHAGDSLLDVARIQNNKGTCRGFILGSGEALSTSEGVCWPTHVTSDEVIEGVKDQIDRSPILHDKQLPAAAAVGLALQELFPCSPKR